MSIETEPVTEEQDKRKRRAGAWLRIGIAGAAVFGIGAGLTVAAWTDFVQVDIEGEGGSSALWIRAYNEDPDDDHRKPGDDASGWKKAVDLAIDGAIDPSKSYDFRVEVYNASANEVVATFTPGTGAWYTGDLASSDPVITLDGGELKAYTITLNASGVPLVDADETFSITAQYVGTAVP